MHRNRDVSSRHDPGERTDGPGDDTRLGRPRSRRCKHDAGEKGDPEEGESSAHVSREQTVRRCQGISSSSTSKTSVEFGPIAGGLPARPYASSDGITNR